MANHNNSGPGQRYSDDDRSSWRPNDDENRSERDRDRYRDREFTTERHGQGQSGYGAGRLGDDFSQGSGSAARGHGYERETGYRGSRVATGGGLHEEQRHDDPRSELGRGRSGFYDSGRGGSGSYRYEPPRGPGERMADDRGSGVYRGMGGHRGKGPQNWQRSDERIRESVNEALTDHDHIDASHIEVMVVNGEVTLSGAVDDRAMKRLAEDCVEQVTGVKEVQNLIRIQRNDGRATGPEGNGRIASTGGPTMIHDRTPRA
jgi:hypothetical protein